MPTQDPECGSPKKRPGGRWGGPRNVQRRVRFDRRGNALIATMLVMTVLMLLGFAMVLQGDTEGLIAVNEQDHMKALSLAEAGLQWARRRVLKAADSGTSFTALLQGPNTPVCQSPPGRCRNLLGLRDLSLNDVSEFNRSNEDTASAVVFRDWDGDGTPETYEAVRIRDGEDRGLVYVRIDDNYDEDPLPNQPFEDRDRRIRVTVVAEYPIFVDANGVQLSRTAARRGVARRTLRAWFGPPVDVPAVWVNGSLMVTDGVLVCGECGSVHANGDLRLGGSGADVGVCQNATATGNFSQEGNVFIGGETGGRPRMRVPIVNPYYARFVPRPEVFNTLNDMSLPPELRCSEPKYFALVAGRVYKAYWNNVLGRWTWRLIDDLSNPSDVQLDDCGRVAACNGEPGCTEDPGHGPPVPDGGPSEFYGFRFFGAEAPMPCDAPDASLNSVENDNDLWNKEDFQSVPGSTIRVLPVSPDPGYRDPDGIPDFDGSTVLGGPPEWRLRPTSPVYSPLHGAVLFVYGDVRLELDGPEVLCGSASLGCGIPMPKGAWPLAVIAYGSIRAEGDFQMIPPSPRFPYALIAGRDIQIRDDVVIGPRGCRRDIKTTQGEAAACGALPGPGEPGAAAIVAAHEQVQVMGNAWIDGFVVAEDANDCSTLVRRVGSAPADQVMRIGGNASIHYDCEHPPNGFLVPVRMTGWQEIQ
jgi:hypothetical protein